ncbi:hypothetical protein [Brevundimonas sp.]|uniref:hypothetical protein n=1 Tax=Brevundimonas sp. TaxID=1871086 RepID=UPI002898B4E6|nr:hypothetical protein [Brevundimonas sp.]
MAKSDNFVNAFTAGEIGEEAWERSDLQQHAKGCEEAFNLIGLVTGPLASRGGFWDRGATTAPATAARMVAFIRAADDALFIEFGDETARVWTTSGDLIQSGGLPYGFDTPWTGAQAFRLWFKQQGDVLYVTDMDGGPTRVIKRLADDDWEVGLFEFRDGPWLTENQNEAVTLTATGLTGLVTLDASLSVFQSEDVGSLIRIREGDGNPGLQTWTSKEDYVGGQQVQYDGRVYQREHFGEDTAGTTPPVHQSGTLSDGAVKWTYLHDGAGVVRIDSFVNAQQVHGTVLRRLPTDLATRYWAKQAYSAAQGFPRALIEEREERLAFASSLERRGTVDLTRTAGWRPDWGDFKPGLGTGRVVDDDAIRLDVGGTSRVVWLLSASVLVAGCTDGEYVLSGAQQDEPMTPKVRRAPPVSAFGNADVAPLLVEGPPPAILHVLRSRKVLRETKIAPDLSVESRNLSILAEHIFGRGVAELAHQQSHNLVWLRLDDGGLAVMVYDMEQQVVGTTRQPLPGGFRVESLACAPSPSGMDVVMATVVREKDGAPQRRVWRLADRSEGVFVDAAAAYDGPPVDAVSGLAHLNGETVAVVADGARVKDRTVVGGVVDLPFAASKVTVGLPMRRRFKTLPLDLQGAGSTNGRTILPTHATVTLDAVEAFVGSDADDGAARVQSRKPDDLTRPGRRRVKQRVALGGGADRDRRVVIEATAPFDLVICSYRLEAEVTK